MRRRDATAAGGVGPYRPLRKLAGFRESRVTDDAPHWASQVALDDQERVIGVYENEPGNSDESILITNRGLYLGEHGSWASLKYKDITGVESPSIAGAQAKFDVDQIWVNLKDGTRHELHVTGRNGTFPDLWPFLRFLRDIDRVVRWEERQSGGNRSRDTKPPNTAAHRA